VVSLNAPLVTICIPTFNRHAELLTTIKSLLIYDDLAKIIVVNDGGAIPVGLPSSVTVLNSIVNTGESAAVNIGWKNCDTQYFTVVSDDDPQPVNWLRPLIDATILRPDAIAFYPSTYMVEKNRSRISLFAKPYNKKNFQNLLRSPCLSGVVINAKKLQNLQVADLRDETIFYPNDLIQWLNLSLLGDFFGVPESNAYWWVHEKQISRLLPLNDKALLYWQNVSKWVETNPTSKSLSFRLLICYLRAVQILFEGTLDPKMLLLLTRNLKGKCNSNHISIWKLLLSTPSALIGLLRIKYE
jgi:glycosyltransferase involved in cell wall biosynthesis